MTWIAVVRMHNGRLTAIVDGEPDRLKEWPDPDTAMEEIEKLPIGQMGYELVQVTE